MPALFAIPDRAQAPFRDDGVRISRLSRPTQGDGKDGPAHRVSPEFRRIKPVHSAACPAILKKLVTSPFGG